MKKTVALFLPIFLIIGLFIVCGPKTVTTASSNAAPNAVTLKTVSMFGGTDPNAKTYQALNKAFTAAHPNVTIQDDSATSNNEWKTKIAADFAVGNEPDVLFFFTDAQAADVLKAGKFVTVKDIRKKYPEYGKDIKADALKGVTASDGKVYALPLTGYYEGLFCNKDLFDKYKLQLPTTWNNLMKAITTFKANRIIPISVSLNEVPHYWIEHLILSQAGVKGHSLNPKDAKAVPESWIKGLEYFKILRDAGAFPKNTDVIKDADAGNLFKNKRAAMQLDGSWFANGVSDKKNTTIIAFPTVPAGVKAPSDIIAGFSSGFYITKKAWKDPDKRKAAIDFVMTHTSTTSIAKYWGGAGTPAAACKTPTGLPKLMADGAKMAAAAKGFDSATDSRLKPEAYGTLLRSISDISTGKITAKEALKNVIKINAK